MLDPGTHLRQRLQEMAGKGLPQVGQKNGKEMLELLQGISGAFRPGILTCLMVGAQPLSSTGSAQWSCTWLLVDSACCRTSCCAPHNELLQLACLLQGVSGAGKTTLMDVLAGRKTGQARCLQQPSLEHQCMLPLASP